MAQPGAPKQERRRHTRVPVSLPARMVGTAGGELDVTLLDVSRGGALISGPAALKAVAFQRKRYMHQPIPAMLLVEGQGVVGRKLLLGRCKYLRKMPDGQYRAGFAFAQVQPQRWVDALARAQEEATLSPQPLPESA